MRRGLVMCCVGLLAAASPGAAGAETPGDLAAKSADESITVHGLAPQAMRREVDKMIYAPWDHQLARWGSQFCPSIEGLPQPYREVVLDHLQRAAHAVIPDLSAHCQHNNVFILFTEDGTAAFNDILAKVPMLGREQSATPISASDADPPSADEVEELRRDHPVRWYRSTMTDPAPGVTVVWNPKFGRYVTNSNGVVSSFRKSTQVRVTSIVVIVDVSRAAGATMAQLADYLAFVVLGSPQLGESFDDISIMSLFDGDHFHSGAPPELTSFDMALLHGLYSADPAQEAHDEQAEIASQVRADLSRSRTAQ